EIGLAFIEQARGDLEAARGLMRQAVQLAGQPRVAESGSAQAAACQAWLVLQQGDGAAALAWAQDRPINIDQKLNHLREREYLTLVRVLIHQRQLDEARLWL